MSKINNEECNCMCHQPGVNMMHCMPCCTKCDYCNKNIFLEYYKEHVEKCKEEHNNEKVLFKNNLNLFEG